MNFKFWTFFKFISCTFKLLETSYSSVAYMLTPTVQKLFY